MTDISTAEVVKRGPGRPPINRENPRPPAEDHKARAAARLAEIRANQIDDGGEVLDKFGIPQHLIPEGWSYEWKTWAVYGKENPQYMSGIYRGGWAPVPASRHPELLYAGYTGDTILKDGMILVERPKILTEEARRKEAQESRAQVAAKEAAMGATPAGTMPRDADKRTAPRINRSIGPVEIPEA